MLFGVVQSSTEKFEVELNINDKGREDINGIIDKRHYEKVKFKGFIEGKTIEDCRNKVIKLNARLEKHYRLYGVPFTRKGDILTI